MTAFSVFRVFSLKKSVSNATDCFCLIDISSDDTVSSVTVPRSFLNVSGSFLYSNDSKAQVYLALD